MLHYRNLPIVYRNDLEKSQIKRFEKSIRFRLPIIVHRRKTIQAQPKLIMPKTTFMELAQLNELKSKYLLFKYRRGKSSQSSYEGVLNSSSSKILLSLPYFITKYNKQTMIKRKWKQIIYAVIVIVRYKKIIIDAQFLEQLNKLPRRRKLSSPVTGHRSPKKRRQASVESNFTLFTKELNVEDTTRSKTSRKVRNQSSDNFVKSIYYQNFKQQDQRLFRLRTNSMQQLQCGVSSRMKK